MFQEAVAKMLCVPLMLIMHSVNARQIHVAIQVLNVD